MFWRFKKTNTQILKDKKQIKKRSTNLKIPDIRKWWSFYN